MLEFWFDPKAKLPHKFALFLMLFALTAILYELSPLTLQSILMFMGTGIIFLICRYCKIHFCAENTKNLIARILHWIPIALLLALIFMQYPHPDLLMLGAQGIGFMALSVCLFSFFYLLNTEKPDA